MRMGKALHLALVFILILNCFIISTPSDTLSLGPLYVGGNNPDYSSIQEAIDNATEGDTIYVHTGIYQENVLINKSIILIGNGSAIVDGRDNIGIHIEVNNTIIDHMLITNCSRGIQVWNAPIRLRNTTLVNNTVYNNSEDGVFLDQADHNTISSNNLDNNTENGIQLINSNDNTIIQNNISNCGLIGLSLGGSTNNIIYHNNLITNADQAYDDGSNSWYNTSINEGNYWDNYAGLDTNGNGIGDVPFIISESQSDPYPLIYQRVSPPSFVWVDDTYDSSTPGYGVDHFATIQNGIDMVVVYGTVYVHDGVYRENGYIMGGKIIRGGALAVIDGMGSWGIRIAGAGHVEIHNMHITNCSYGIFLRHCRFPLGILNVSLFNNTINNCSYGIYFMNTRWGNITSNTVINSSYSGIALSCGLDINISMNHISDSVLDGINLLRSRSDTITSNTIYNSTRHGINLTESYKNNITSNTIYNNSESGIYLGDSSNNNTICANQVFQNLVDGIYVWYSDDNDITNNTAYNNIKIGIYLGGSQRNDVIGNTIFNNFLHGFSCWNSHDNTLISNLVYNNAPHGIYLIFSDRNNIANNTIYNNTHGGINLTASSFNNVTANEVSINSASGLQLNLADNNTIWDNTVYNNSVYGLHIVSVSPDNTVFNNYFSNTQNIRNSDLNTILNVSKNSGRNIVSGPFIGGNYWSAYTGFDSNHDGFGDSKFNDPDGNSFDSLPLVISPRVLSTSPLNGTTDVSRSPDIVMVFNKAMNQTTVETNVSIAPSVDLAFTWSENNKTVTISPIYNLQWGSPYTIRLDWNATDTDGNVMLDNYTWTFRVKQRPRQPSLPADDPETQPTQPTLTGPSLGECNDTLTYTAVTTEPDDNPVQYFFSWGDGSTSDWTEPKESGTQLLQTHTWITEGTYEVKVKARDATDLEESDWSTPILLTITEPVNNTPPNTPAASSGRSSGFTNQSYNYTSRATDPDNDQIQYRFNSGDGTISDWTHLVDSGTNITLSHRWLNPGSYSITIQARDEHGAESSWSDPLSVIIKTDYTNTTGTLSIFIEDEQHLLADTDDDGTYDILVHSNGEITDLGFIDDDYLIDIDSDGEWDYQCIVDDAEYRIIKIDQKPQKFPWALAIMGVIAAVIIIMVYLIYKKRYQLRGLDTDLDEQE